MTGHTDSVTCMAIDGNLLFTGSDDCTIRSWELTLNTPSGELGRHEEGIQDLLRLDNGLLLSCAYDGKIICWHYNEDTKFGEIVKENQQLRCMDYVSESGTLLVGTNTFAILTQSITEWVNFGGIYDEDNLAIEFDSMAEGEEYKYGADDSYGDEMDGRQNMGDSDYDILEGQTLDEAIGDIVANNKTGALAFLQE